MYRRGEGHGEEWVLNMFIQHQYQALMGAYKKHSSINMKTYKE